MEAKDTVMNVEVIAKLIDDAPEYTYNNCDYERYFIKAGIKEVVEWIKENPQDFGSTSEAMRWLAKWQAQKKVWGI